MATRLNIIGCGRAARVLARLWHEAGQFRIGWILNRSPESAARARDFIGAGDAVAEPGRFQPGDWLMLGLPDGDLASVAEGLRATSGDRAALAFHLSGLESSEVLRGVADEVASVHPVCPFSDPGHALRRFAGSHALGEGDAGALDRVLPCFDAIGARAARFSPKDKRLYHAAMISASNFVVTLDDLALNLAEQAGLERDRALELITDLQRGALDNIAALGPVGALTGPIERGDESICDRLAAMSRALSGPQRALFSTLASATAALAARKHPERAESLRELARRLQSSTDPEPVRTSPEPSDGGV